MFINDPHQRIKVRNLTPHTLNWINPQKVFETRNGEKFLAPNTSLRDAVIESLQQANFILKVEDREPRPLVDFDGIRLFDNINGHFRVDVPPDLLNEADALIVSKKCTDVIKHLSFINQMPYFYADKFYSPYGIVYSNDPRDPKNTTIPKVIGCLGIQRAVPLYNDLKYYHQGLLIDRAPVSTLSVFAVCQSYVSQSFQDRIRLNNQFNYETLLDDINRYFQEKFGNEYFAPYPLLRDLNNGYPGFSPYNQRAFNL